MPLQQIAMKAPTIERFITLILFVVRLHQGHANMMSQRVSTPAHDRTFM